MNHKLKIQPEYLAAKLAGDKLFEVRLNDRGYQKGDTVSYVEPVPTMENESKNILHTYEITYVTNYMQLDGFVVFGEKHVSSEPRNFL